MKRLPKSDHGHNKIVVHLGVNDAKLCQPEVAKMNVDSTDEMCSCRSSVVGNEVVRSIDNPPQRVQHVLLVLILEKVASSQLCDYLQQIQDLELIAVQKIPNDLLTASDKGQTSLPVPLAITQKPSELFTGAPRSHVITDLQDVSVRRSSSCRQHTGSWDWKQTHTCQSVM